LDKYFNHRGYTVNAAHHSECGENVGSHPGYVATDSQSGSLCTGSDKVVAKALILAKQESRQVVHLIRHASKKIQNVDKQMILLLSQVHCIGMLGTNLDC